MNTSSSITKSSNLLLENLKNTADDTIITGFIYPAENGAIEISTAPNTIRGRILSWYYGEKNKQQVSATLRNYLESKYSSEVAAFVFHNHRETAPITAGKIREMHYDAEFHSLTKNTDGNDISGEEIETRKLLGQFRDVDKQRNEVIGSLSKPSSNHDDKQILREYQKKAMRQALEDASVSSAWVDRKWEERLKWANEHTSGIKTTDLMLMNFRFPWRKSPRYAALQRAVPTQISEIEKKAYPEYFILRQKNSEVPQIIC
jgi:hypothetical protein